MAYGCRTSPMLLRVCEGIWDNSQISILCAMVMGKTAKCHGEFQKSTQLTDGVEDAHLCHLCVQNMTLRWG